MLRLQIYWRCRLRREGDCCMRQSRWQPCRVRSPQQVYRRASDRRACARARSLFQKQRFHAQTGTKTCGGCIKALMALRLHARLHAPHAVSHAYASRTCPSNTDENMLLLTSQGVCRQAAVGRDDHSRPRVCRHDASGGSRIAAGVVVAESRPPPREAHREAADWQPCLGKVIHQAWRG